MKPKVVLVILCSFTLCAALSGLVLHSKRSAPSRALHPRVFQVRGEVREVDLIGKILRVAHEEIPGYMPAMTMPLPVKDVSLLKNLAAGDAVQFELSVTDDDSWIAQISRITAGPDDPPSQRGASDASDVASELQKGEIVPDFKLTDQNGQPLRLADLRGKVVVVTFVYTRCPLPNFCPLMSKNFQSLQQRLENAMPGQFHLVSVSIDPHFDTPEVLKEYASRYAAEEKSWSFVTGSDEQINSVASLFGLVYEPESGLISHNLRTALIGPDGRLLHVWKSNVWTPYEVQRMINETIPAAKGMALK